MNYRMITSILGWIMVFEAIFMTFPIVTALAYGETVFWDFFFVALFCLIFGFLATRLRPKNTALYAREGFVIVALSWIVLSVFGALPMCLSGAIPSFVDALFESVSGFTTTGASVVASVDDLPKSILMWRSFTHWIGGMGVLVFIMAFLPLSGAQNMHIMKAESPGPSVSKLVPRVKTTALLLYTIYLVLTFVEFFLLICGSMPVFDAIIIAFGTAGTGGFSVHNSGLAGYSPYLQVVVTVFMLLFSLNFGSYFLLLRGKWKDAFNTEIRAFLLIVGVSITLITLNINSLFGSIGETLRHAAFTVASIISTTGFSTVDFNLWPELSRAILVLLMFIGACAGSTGGGMKVSRIIILCKGVGKELHTLVHPKQVKRIKMDSHQIEHEVVRSVNAYVVCYMVVFVCSLLLVSFDNHDLITSFTAVAATINNIGPGLELVGPTANFGFFSSGEKLVLIFDMLAGRLELFPILLLFSPATWKK